VTFQASVHNKNLLGGPATESPIGWIEGVLVGPHRFHGF
jgi:hypothetical protein